MSHKKTYYTLDDIGFIGTPQKRTKLQQKRDSIKTGEIIRREKIAAYKKALLLKKAS
ncbi:MAG: hypothetical protein QM763_19120 [Agriterribacter sp.]